MRVPQKRTAVSEDRFQSPKHNGECLLFELVHEFHLDWKVDVAPVASVSQKLANRCASSLAIIAGKFIHVHADEFAGELRVHVACVCERISDGFVPMCETVVDAFANDLAEVTSHWWRDVLAHYVSA